MDKAVTYLDAFMQTKTVHSTESILMQMGHICNEKLFFTGQEAQQDFAQKCRNFEIYSEQWNIKSWGRRKFEEWWNGFSTDERQPKPGAFSKEVPMTIPAVPGLHAMEMIPFEGGMIPFSAWGNPPSEAQAPYEFVKPPWEEETELCTMSRQAMEELLESTIKLLKETDGIKVDLYVENLQLKEEVEALQKELKRLNGILDRMREIIDE